MLQLFSLFVLLFFQHSMGLGNTKFLFPEIQNQPQQFILEKEGGIRESIDAYNVIYQMMEWQVDPNVNFISGKITSYIIPENDLSSIEFNMSALLIADSVFVNNTKIILFDHSSDILQIPTELNAEQTDTILVYYHGTPAGTGFGSFVQDTPQ